MLKKWLTALEISLLTQSRHVCKTGDIISNQIETKNMIHEYHYLNLRQRNNVLFLFVIYDPEQRNTPFLLQKSNQSKGRVWGFMTGNKIYRSYNLKCSVYEPINILPVTSKNQRNIARYSTAIGTDQRLISCSLMKFNVGQVPMVNIHTAGRKYTLLFSQNKHD